MRRYSLLSVLAVVAASALFFACTPKVQAPPPECKVDFDCGANKRCEAGKCIFIDNAKERAESQIKRAEEMLKNVPTDYNAVIAAYQAALNDVPNTPGLEFNIALCYMKMGDYDKAESYFKKQSQSNPDDGNAVMALGLIASKRGDDKGALALYTDFLKTHPDNLEMMTNVATIYRNMKKYDEALNATRKILIKDPAFPGAYNNLGLIYLAQGKILLSRMVTESGIKAQENVKKKPDAGLYNNLGLIYMQMGLDDQAVANWRKAYEIDPTLLSVNLNLGHKALGYADFARARKHYEAVLAQDPINRDALLGLAQCLAPLKEHDKALAIYTQYLDAHPKDAVAWFNFGVFNFDHLKKQQEAHDAFRKFLAIGYDDKAKITVANNYLLQEIAKPQAPEPPKEKASEISNDMPVVPDAVEGAAPAPAPAGNETPAVEQNQAPAVEQPAPAPAAEPAPAPAPAPAAEPAAPAPAPAPAAEPAPAPAPAPAAEPAPAPVAEPVPAE